MLSAKVDTSGWDKMMRTLNRRDLPKAARNTLKDLMRDAVLREKQEIASVFDRPKPLVRNGVKVVKQPTNNDLTGIMAVAHSNPTAHAALERTIKPHVPGFRRTRAHKGLERSLQRRGMLKRNQYLVPSRTMRLDKYGNVSLANVNRMITDLTGRGTARSDRFIWATVHAQRGDVSGIWIRSRMGKGGALAMLAVDDAPTYRKRFRFHDVAMRHANLRMSYFAERTTRHYIRNVYGR